MSSPISTRHAKQKAKIQTRALVKSTEARTPSLALVEAKRRAKDLKMRQPKEDILNDIYNNAINSVNIIKKDTGIVYDDSMHQHCCLWDKNHPERPERFIRVLERCNDLHLIEKCNRIMARRATKEEVLLIHSEEHYNYLESTENITNEAQLEKISSQYDSIYIHPTTFDLSLLAVGSTISLIEKIVKEEIQNGMAIIRPPGHHAMQSEFNGYCFLNNVAIAAKYALEKLNLKRILIVDWDIHHGQGTQSFYYEDPRVLYFSIHRFEHGKFWPNLKESQYDHVGEGPGKGYNFNVPLNKTGMKNEDYLAIFQQLLIPVAVEFQPEIIIISAGYDAALGCPEGEMEITPAFYSHLIQALNPLAQSKLAVILEGGYCLESLAEGAALTLRSLIGDPCPSLIEPLKSPCESVQESILNCIYTHKPFWKSLSVQSTYSLEEFNNINPQPNLHKVKRTFVGGDPLPAVFPTRNCYPIQSPDSIKLLEDRLKHLKLNTCLGFPKNRLCYVYDEAMTKHMNLFEESHPEQPDRIKRINDRFAEFRLFKRMERVQSRSATTDELCLVHTRSHVNSIRRITSNTHLKEMAEKFNSVYFHPSTFESATLAVGSVLQVIDNVLNAVTRSGICIVRPPGHHAEPDVPHGFCIFNNVAIAAHYALRNHGLKRILIVDWDVHHGNGTQHIFENNPNVLYISLHRYDNGKFFPKSKDADYDVVGSGPGEGFNVNIPWNKKGMGDMEYVLAMQQIVLPIAYEFNPELVIVSAGFDAATGDPLGGCKVSPEAYGHFTHWLAALANGKIVICLEGGYNINSISYAMVMCTKALLGDPMPKLHLNDSKSTSFLSCIETIQKVLSIQQKYWKSLKFNKKLPNFHFNEIEGLEAKFEHFSLQSKREDSDSNLEGAVGNFPNNDDDIKTNTKQESKGQFDAEFFAVFPLKYCSHLSELNSNEVPANINTKLSCAHCLSTKENWICLHCLKVFCGRFVIAHMVMHNMETKHPLVLSFSDLSVWCYSCESYIDNSILYVYKNAAHIDKFGEELTWSYD